MASAKSKIKQSEMTRKKHLQLIKPKTKNAERALKKQRQLVRGALKVFTTKGFHASSLREIAEASQMSLGSIYDYIEKKEDILYLVHNEIMDQIFNQLKESIERYEDPIKNFDKILFDLFSLSRQLHDEVKVIFSETKSLDKEYRKHILARESAYVSVIEAIITDGVKKGAFECTEPALMANIITHLGAIMPLRGWNIMPRNSAEDVHHEIVQLIFTRLKSKADLDLKHM
ncbi:MAG: TetR/AcrR family transcriptional regulator [Proteobacteria bacterium]|nr:TetR/AcrR family transcriptional regulator [Pseudomonadota bacterium]